MSELERRKKQLELSRVKLAREEMEFRIAEREDEINRMREAIKKQDEREAELLQELKENN